MAPLLPHPVYCLCLQARDRYCHSWDVFSLLFTFFPLTKIQEMGTLVFWLTGSWFSLGACYPCRSLLYTVYAMKWTAVFLEVTSQRKTEGLQGSLFRCPHWVQSSVSVCWSSHCSPASSWFPSSPSLLCIQLFPPSEVGLSAPLSQ